MLFLSSCSISCFAQDQKFSATVAFPLAFGDFEYTGIADLGLQYRVIVLGPVALGASVNAGFLGDSDNTGTATVENSAFLVQPRVYGELAIPSLEQLKPFVGLGYTWAHFNTDFGGREDIEADEGGFNVNVGVAYDITTHFFAILQLDNTALTTESSREILTASGDFEVLTFETTSNLTLLKIGVGLRF